MKTDEKKNGKFDARAALPAAFGPFLSRFGSLTGIQESTIPLLLEGSDAVVVAPAASGKTEAVLAPLFERLAGEPSKQGPIGILYIVPTRALANDIDVRVREPIGAMKMHCRVRTGDKPSPVGDGRIDLLVTTPESFDSLLCRHPAAFDTLSAIVIDEAHLMDQTARGDQLMVLLRRVLMKKAARRPQLVAMTATVANPAELGERLFGTAPPVVSDDRHRPMDSTLVDDLEAALTLLRREKLTKAIIFCNTRRKTEETAAAAARIGPWPPERIMVHHASLSRTEREDVEKAFRYFEAGLLVSTSTMELGVDIGNVDAVVLVGAPGTVASLHQRVGRGCRRRNGMRAVFVPDQPGDAEAFASLMKDVKDRIIPPVLREPDLSVAVQQIFSLLFENRRGLRRRTLRHVLEVLAEGPVIDEIVDHLRSGGFLDEGAGEIVRASSRLMDMGEKGRIHSNISDSGVVRVVDSGTGRTVGMVSSRTRDGAAVTIGGRNWTVTGKSGGGVAVRAAGGGDEVSGAIFGNSSGSGAFSRFLPESLRGNRSRER